MKLYKYTFRSPLTGSICCDELFREDDGVKELESLDMARLYNADPDLSDFLEKNKEDLTQYLPDYFKKMMMCKLEVGDYGVVNGDLCLLAHVWTTTKLTENQIGDVSEYISGQYSDGWGEGLEQREWRTDSVQIPIIDFDIYEGEWEEDSDSAGAYFYVHPWNDNQFFIELHYCEEEEIPDPEPVVQSAKCEIMPNGGYSVRTVYRLNSEEEVLNHIKNSGLIYSDEFYQWIKNFGTFGQNLYLYLVVVNEGLFNKILPMLGVLYKDASRANLFSIDAESGEINLDEYMEEESMDFYNDLLNK